MRFVLASRADLERVIKVITGHELENVHVERFVAEGDGMYGNESEYSWGEWEDHEHVLPASPSRPSHRGEKIQRPLELDETPTLLSLSALSTSYESDVLHSDTLYDEQGPLAARILRPDSPLAALGARLLHSVERPGDTQSTARGAAEREHAGDAWGGVGRTPLLVRRLDFVGPGGEPVTPTVFSVSSSSSQEDDEDEDEDQGEGEDREDSIVGRGRVVGERLGESVVGWDSVLGVGDWEAAARLSTIPRMSTIPADQARRTQFSQDSSFDDGWDADAFMMPPDSDEDDSYYEYEGDDNGTHHPYIYGDRVYSGRVAVDTPVVDTHPAAQVGAGTVVDMVADAASMVSKVDFLATKFHPIFELQAASSDTEDAHPHLHAAPQAGPYPESDLSSSPPSAASGATRKTGKLAASDVTDISALLRSCLADCDGILSTLEHRA